MKSSLVTAILAASLAQLGVGQSVVGSAEGFAAGVTGGGSATAEYPTDIDELKSMLTDSTPRVIVLNKEYDFTGSEGTTTGTVCASWGTGSACQKIIQDDCGSSTKLTATWDTAGTQPIDIASNKTLIGVGTSGVIKGKGLRVRGDASNVIIQNIEVTDLNHEYVWGGDTIGFDGADLVWVDHVKTTRPGRQHYVFGFDTSTRITLSNNFVNGNSTFSTGCDGYHYWVFEMVGDADQITMKNNYIYHTAGRGPALSGGTLLHAVNNVWDDIKGHALEGGEATAKGIFEGNVFNDVKIMVSDYQGKLFTSPDSTTNAQCQSALGRSCETNLLTGTTSDSFSYKDTSFFSDFDGLTIASAAAASAIQSSVPSNAGPGKLDSSSTGTGSSKAATPTSKTGSSPQTTLSTVTPSTLVATKAAVASGAASAAVGSVALYGQCGGNGYTGSTVCATGKCVEQNPYYSQCIEV
ncbi:putative pectin lyase A [Thozetella sp. PMI_491]|nr:putative pectin lyase A [Thozetella sp. PMI_491]